MLRCVKTVLVSSVLLVTGCATMTPEECLNADWYQQGMRDGQSGQSLSIIEDHNEACNKVGVSVNRTRYVAGRDAGLVQYCTPATGFDEGRRGKYYGDVCPPALERPFVEAYRQGRRIYDAQRRVDSLQSDLNSQQYQLDRAKDDDTRARIRRHMRDLDDRLRRARDDLYYIERQSRDYR